MSLTGITHNLLEQVYRPHTFATCKLFDANFVQLCSIFFWQTFISLFFRVIRCFLSRLCYERATYATKSYFRRFLISHFVIIGTNKRREVKYNYPRKNWEKNLKNISEKILGVCNTPRSISKSRNVGSAVFTIPRGLGEDSFLLFVPRL